MDNVGKWYTFTEYYNEDGVQISKKDAKRNYIIIGKNVINKVNGNTGTRTICYHCERDKQYKLFQ